MTTERRLERDLPEILSDLAMGPYPDYIDDVLATTAHRRQRPAWTFPERWLPVELTTPSVFRPALPWRQLGVLALIALLIAAAVAAFVGSSQPLPAPFGPAANGRVAYVTPDGAITTSDPRTGESTVIVPGPGHESPVFSPNGRRLAFMKKDSVGDYDLVVTDPLGTAPFTITEEPLLAVDYLAWSPDGAYVVVAVPPGHILFFDASRQAPPRILTGPDGTGLTVSGGLNPLTQILFRPPAGDELMFVQGSGGSVALYAIRPDGSGRRTIIDSRTAGPTIASLEVPQWSPDGKRIAVAVSAVREGDHRKLWIVNADGTELRPLTHGPAARDEGHLQWSPDGTKVAFMRWVDWPDGSSGVNVRPITVVDVASGDETEVGEISLNGFNGWTWSPDGQSILQIPGESSHVVVLPSDPAVAPEEFRDWTSRGTVTWQRTTP
jgi:WD40 repeat protein